MVVVVVTQSLYITMWYEILPSLFLVVGCTSVPYLACPLVNYMWYGKPVYRGCEEQVDKDMYRRDCKLDPTGKGDGLISVYWEGIPDKK